MSTETSGKTQSSLKKKKTVLLIHHRREQLVTISLQKGRELARNMRIKESTLTISIRSYSSFSRRQKERQWIRSRHGRSSGRGIVCVYVYVCLCFCREGVFLFFPKRPVEETLSVRVWNGVRIKRPTEGRPILYCFRTRKIKSKK